MWPLAENWRIGLEKWYEDTNPNRVSFQAGTMTDGVSHRSRSFHVQPTRGLTQWIQKEPQPYALRAMPTMPSMPPTPTSATTVPRPDARASVFHRPPSPQTEYQVQQQEDAKMETGKVATRLAPMQQMQTTYGEAICLPPLAPTPHVHQAQQPMTPQRPINQNQPPHQQIGQVTYQGQPQNTGFDALLQASHQAPIVNPFPQQTTYYQNCPTIPLNDGFDNNLQILLDGGAMWTATDATAAIYNTYGGVDDYHPPQA
jgi:hypothetical protein